MKKIHSKDGTSIAYQRSGQGPPLLLVHGALATHARWSSILPALEKQFTVYALDRRGRGESGDGESYAIEREFEDVAAVVNSIGKNVNLLGHSYGALCSLEASLLTPNIRRLIAYEPPPAPVQDGLMDRIQAALDTGDKEEAVIIFMRDLVKMPAPELDQWRSTAVFPVRVTTAHTIPREFNAAQGYQVEPERFKHLNVPTLLLLGGDSPPFARTNVENWHRALPNSRIVILPGQQHIAMDTAPDLFVHEVVTFLND